MNMKWRSGASKAKQVHPKHFWLVVLIKGRGGRVQNRLCPGLSSHQIVCLTECSRPEVSPNESKPWPFFSGRV